MVVRRSCQVSPSVDHLPLMLPCPAQDLQAAEELSASDLVSDQPDDT
jgi:hypothetical protein